MSGEKVYLCDEYKLYFKIEDDVKVLQDELDLYNTSFVGNNCLCHEEKIDGQRTIIYSIPAMITMEQFITKKIHRDELLDIMFSITDQMMFIKANELALGKIILSSGYMYLNLENMSVQLIFLPIDKPMDKCNMEKFVREFINRLNFANKKASDCGYDIIKFFDDNSTFYLSEFYKFIVELKKDSMDQSEVAAKGQKAGVDPVLVATAQSAASFKLAKEKKDYSSTDIGFNDDEDSDMTSTTVLTSMNKPKKGPSIVRTRTGEKILIDKPLFCIGKSANGVDYQVTDNSSVSRRHAYIVKVNGLYYLRDNKSTNHTYIDGKMIKSGTDVSLTDGTIFKLADEEFTFMAK